ncbi:MAG TPA: HAD family phosphatase [Candidatus Limnocylindrales bacterium]|nr:HAD family phosphatase [Candidatus Limnocylindrales bacterium]
MTAEPRFDAVVFDLGGVLIDWSPRYLYRQLLPDEAAVDAFLTEVGFEEWNVALDAGRDWDEAVEWLATRHPERRDLVEAFRDRWEETLGEADEAVVEIARELRTAGIRTFALTNWSGRTFAIARRRFAFLDEFEGIVVSGEVGATKPDERIYRALLERYALDPGRTLFIDDRAENIDAAARLGIEGLVFDHDPAELRRDLAARGLPLGRDEPVNRR